MSRAPLTAIGFSAKFDTIQNYLVARHERPANVEFSTPFMMHREEKQKPASCYHEAGSLSNHKNNYINKLI
jgi:hypothetical protein